MGRDPVKTAAEAQAIGARLERGEIDATQAIHQLCTCLAEFAKHVQKMQAELNSLKHKSR